ncbi:MAG: 16S rRNA (cytosine(1402)-N(4))-methyltransferase RsmH [Candidatus Neomarinimicrobiota bacterium]
MSNLQENSQYHIPVMTSEVLEFLNLKMDGVYIDGTIGAGGHTNEILSNLSSKAKVIGLDRDNDALEISKKRLIHFKKQISLHHSSYHHISNIMKLNNISKVDGILLDLGLSSMQLNTKNRGFSFQKNDRIDMRFDQSSGETANELINRLSQEQLADIIFEFGEERRSRRIAKSIKKSNMLITTNDLTDAIRKSTPPHQRNKTLARVYQALRIAVNNEIEKLKNFLEIFLHHLNSKGRLVIISYHSIEDRLVKNFFRQLKLDNKANILTKKPLTPSTKEIQSNRRSRSAKIRALEKI